VEKTMAIIRTRKAAAIDARSSLVNSLVTIVGLGAVAMVQGGVKVVAAKATRSEADKAKDTMSKVAQRGLELEMQAKALAEKAVEANEEKRAELENKLCSLRYEWCQLQNRHSVAAAGVAADFNPTGFEDAVEAGGDIAKARLEAERRELEQQLQAIESKLA
jgi:hypothetical protein